MQIYSADRTLKAEYGASTGVASDFWNNVKSDGLDIRLADQDYSQLYFYVEKFDYSGKYAVIWVKIPANTMELYIAYGNPSATKSSYEDPTQVFEFFDDFETLDTNVWTWYGLDRDPFVEDGWVHVDYDSATGWNYFATQTAVFTQANGYVVESREMHVSNYPDAGSLSLGAVLLSDYQNSHAVSELRYSTGTIRIRYNGNLYNEVSAFTPQPNDVFILRAIIDSNQIIAEVEKDGNVYSTSYSVTPDVSGYNLCFFQFGVYHKIDWVRVLKLADPVEFGDAEVITLVTTGDFITVTFSFDEGVDKLLITVDTDAQAVYYSTDDGATWNAIEPDTETLLPETAYSIKWKFEFATYVRGYAFITW